MDVVEPLNLKKGNCISIDEKTHKINWVRYNYIKDLCTLYLINGTVIMWTFPIEIFNAFGEVIILT